MFFPYILCIYIFLYNQGGDIQRPYCNLLDPKYLLIIVTDRYIKFLTAHRRLNNIGGISTKQRFK